MLSHKGLPVGKILLAALLIAYERRVTFTRSLLVPFTALTLAQFSVYRIPMEGHLPGSSPFSGMLFSFLIDAVFAIFFAPLAVRCHRVVLLGSHSVGSSLRWMWTKRETRFALFLVAFSAGWHLLLMTFMMAFGFLLLYSLDIASDILKNPKATSFLVSYIVPISGVAGTSYVFSRLSIIFPSIAIDEPLTLRAAWHTSAGNGWRLLIILAIFFYVQQIGWTLPLYESHASVLVAVALFNILGIFGIVALSLSYAELRKYSAIR